MSEFLKKDITYITALTVIPEEKKQRKFINESKALLREKDRLWIMGKKAEGMKKFPVDSRIALFTEGEELIKQISKRG
jgi:hypothetical protein